MFGLKIATVLGHLLLTMPRTYNVYFLIWKLKRTIEKWRRNVTSAETLIVIANMAVYSLAFYVAFKNTSDQTNERPPTDVRSFTQCTMLLSHVNGSVRNLSLNSSTAPFFCNTIISEKIFGLQFRHSITFFTCLKDELTGYQNYTSNHAFFTFCL